MSTKFEVYLSSLVTNQQDCKDKVINRVQSYGGDCTFVERSGNGVVLTFEFNNLERASDAYDDLYKQGYHVEGFSDY